jgi:hypothetical protein
VRTATFDEQANNGQAVAFTLQFSPLVAIFPLYKAGMIANIMFFIKKDFDFFRGP